MDGISGMNVGGATLPGVAGTNLHMDNYEVNGRYALTPAINLAASYTFTDGSMSGSNGSGDPKWHTVSLQGDYSLSKRTDVYVEAVYQHASGQIGNFGSNVAAINMLAPSSNGDQVAAAVGLRHRF
jgi:predicted porin